ncbi:MAG: uracil phosphoribosyltransferase [Gemmatimonadota bacterium]|nr:uracil phosphoribosyltransferase [Gemmatimonadota bacterium]MDH4347677.1 uracil phosphoribosyltransferase [Gemmatimonadota bacterium]
MTHTRFPNLTVIGHPLVQHKLSLLRRRATSSRDFKQLVAEISMLIAYEATRDLPVEAAEIETPLGQITGHMVSSKRLILVPILRAGLGMLDGVSHLLPNARVGHIGMKRDEASLEPTHYYTKLPIDEPGPDAKPSERRTGLEYFILDPMLATGGSATAAVTTLKTAGAYRIRLLCIVAAPEGIQRMLDGHPDVRIYTASLDEGLNAQGYIVPGLGDAGDRIFGTA